MKKLLLVLLFPIITFAQVGVNTTTPKAALDVESTNNGVLIPRVQLTSILDNTTIINPNAGPLETSTLIYNIGPAGVVPNNVIAGFYYWNGSQWIAIAGNSNKWSLNGNANITTPVIPVTYGTSTIGATENFIGTKDNNDVVIGTDNVERFRVKNTNGNVGIGTANPTSKLDIQGININNGIQYNLTKGISSGDSYSFDNTMNINTNDNAFGIRNTFLGTGNGLKVGILNSTTTGILGSKTGFENDLQASGSDFLFGFRNTLTNSGSNSTLGLNNRIINPLGSTGFTRGVQNVIISNSTQETSGVFNLINSPAGGAGGTFGMRSFITGSKTGGKYGVFNQIETLVPDDLYGYYSIFSIGSSASPSRIYGNYNYITTDRTSSSFGIVNNLIGSTSGSSTGVENLLSNDINGQDMIGTNNVLLGSGTSDKYGTKTFIEQAAGGTHYGIHSTVLKPGSNNFAGYFLGNVGIGTTIANTYTLPSSRGTNGQIMQTDGTGNVTWQNINNSFWSLNGNAGTNPPLIFGTPIVATENFIGTNDTQDLILGTNNLEKIRLKGNSFNIGIGITNPLARLDIFDQGAGTTVKINKTSLSALSTGLEVSLNGMIGFGGTKIGGIFSAIDGTNNYALLVPANSGLVGFGTNTPTTKLHVVNPTAGALRLEDGTQAAGRVLTSDANGVGTWQSIGTLGLSWTINGNSAINTPTIPATYGTSLIGGTENFIGTTNANDFTVGTNRIERMRVKNTTGFIGIGTANPSTPLEVASNGINEFRLSSRGAFGASRFSMISDKELATEWRPTYIESGDNGSFTGRMDFYTNGTGIANRFGSVRAMSIVNGNVGVGITNPSQKLHAFENADTNKSVILGEARQINTGTDFLNIGVKGDGNGSGAWGFGIGVLGMSDINNTYNSTGVYALLGTVNPTFSSSVSRNQALIANGNGIGNSAMFVGGNMGVGVPLDTNPTNLVHINSATSGAVRIVDGSQSANRVLTSDATGVATWRESALTGVTGNLVTAGGGISIPFTQTSGFLQTGSSITLPPGRYVVNVTMLMSVFPTTSTNNSSFWLRTAFSDSSTASPTRTADTVGSYYVSGNLPGSSYFSILSGSLIINNTSGANKTYYYIAGEALTNNTTQSLGNFSGWGEDGIVAYRLN